MSAARGTMADMEGYWILNGPGHRLAEAQAMVVGIAEELLANPDGPEPIIIDSGEEWICDGCNGEIPTFLPDGAGGPDPTKLAPAGQLRPIPVVNGRVLCPECFYKQMGDDLRVANTWGACGCPPCVAANVR